MGFHIVKSKINQKLENKENNMEAYESQMSWNQQNQDTRKQDQKSQSGGTVTTVQEKTENGNSSRKYHNLSFTLVEGFVTAKPRLAETKTGKPVCHFSIAMNHRFGNGEGSVSFLDIESWGKRGQNCSTYLDKGSRVIVQGYLRQDRWENGKGEKRSHLKLVSDSVTFLPSAKRASQ